MIDIKRPHNSRLPMDGTYYSRNREKILKRVKAHAIKNADKIKAYQKEYGIKNRDSLNERSKQYRLSENKAAHAEYDKQYREENHDKLKSQRILYAQTMEGRFAGWKNGAIKRKKDWNLTIEYLKSLPIKCHYTGMDLTFESNKINTISLDRIDSSKGYQMGNVVFCMAIINSMKNSLPTNDFVALCKMVVSHSVSITF